MDNSATIWHLIARVLNGEATTREQHELFDILSQDELLQQQYDLLSRIWQEKEGNLEFEDKDAAQSTIYRIINKAESEGRHIELSATPTRFNRRRIWMAAASILVLVSAGWFWFNRGAKDAEPKQEAIEAKHGSRSRSLLPDGTTVWLNAGSKLSYDGDFTGATREVRLEGEAFFD